MYRVYNLKWVGNTADKNVYFLHLAGDLNCQNFINKKRPIAVAKLAHDCDEVFLFTGKIYCKCWKFKVRNLLLLKYRKNSKAIKLINAFQKHIKNLIFGEMHIENKKLI